MATPQTVLPQPQLGPQAKALIDIFGDKFAATFRGAQVTVPHRFYTDVSQRLFKKDFEYLSRMMYYEYLYRSWNGYNAEVLDRFSTLVTTKMAAVKTIMTNQITRLKTLLEQNGKDREEARAFFTTVVDMDVAVIASTSRVYLELLHLMDEVHVLSGGANLWGIIDSPQRAECERLVRNAVRAMGNLVRFEAPKLYREANRLREEHRTRGEETPMAAVVQAHGEDIKKGEAEGAADREGDADPALAIDTAAKISAAGVTTTQKRKPKAAPAEAVSSPASPAGAPAAAQAEAAT